VLALIIYGTRGVTSTNRQGKFHCPSCGPDTRFEHKVVRRFFTLYFIPLIPLDQLGEYIECTLCAGTFTNEVLKFDPRAGQEEAEAEFRTVMRRVMIDLMMADGVMEEEELKTVAAIYEKVSGKPLSKRRLDEELKRLEKEGPGGTVAFLRKSQGLLNEKGKQLVMHAALAVAFADGSVQDEEKVLLAQFADAMGLTAKQFKALLAEATEPPAGA
jgi:uncharacterized tellurite resistance protein B-like protein